MKDFDTNSKNSDSRTNDPWGGLAGRLAVGMVLVVAFAGLLVGVPLHHTARGLLEKSLQERAEAVAETIAVALDVPEGPLEDPEVHQRLAERIQDLVEEADLDRLDLADAAGNLILSTDDSAPVGEPDDLLRSAGIPLSDLLKQDAATTPLRFDRHGRASVLAVAPVMGSQPQLFVAARAPASWSSALDGISWRIAVAVGAWMLVAAGMGLVMTRRSLRPLERLQRATRAMTNGDTSTELPRSGLHELDTLADDFDRMRVAVVGRERWLRALAGTVAHEVRNPAHALRLQLGLLRRSVGELEAGRFNKIEGELDELEATVSSLLAFAEGAPAHRLATELHGLMRRAATGALIVCPDVVVYIDPILVGRAVANLVRNARQAGAGRVELEALLEGGEIVIRVSDDGPGFPPGLALLALEPFARGAGGGSGLGLALVTAVAAAHGGSTRIVRPGPGGTQVEMRLRDTPPGLA